MRGAKPTISVLLIACLALPFTSPLREISRRSSVCPLDLGLAIEEVFSRPAALDASHAATRVAADHVAFMAEHGVARDHSHELGLELRWATPAEPLDRASPPPSLPDSLCAAPAPRPRRERHDAPCPVRGPPAPLV